MDIEKVLGIFKELIEEEEEYAIQNLLNNLLSHLNSNDSDAVAETISKINEYSKESSINDYAFSKLKVLDKVNAKKYFGVYLKEFINTFFTKETYKSKDNLSQFIKQRNTLLTNLKNNIQNLESFDFESYYDTLGTFELGLVIPVNQSELKKVNNYLKEWHFVLRHISELCEKEHSEPKIYSVSKNSIGIFFLCSIPVAKCILSLTKDVLDIYKKVLEIKKLKKDMEKYDSKFKQGIKEASKVEKEIVNEEKEKIVKKIILEYESQIPKEREKELEVSIRKSIEIIIKMQDKGIIIEATPPKIEEPEILEEEETKENKKKRDEVQKAYNSKIEQINKVTVIANKAKTVKELISSEKNVLQIAQYLDKDIKQGSEEDGK